VNRSQKWDAPILETREDRLDKFLHPYFRNAKPMENRWHLQFAQRWVVQYNFLRQ